MYKKKFNNLISTKTLLISVNIVIIIEFLAVYCISTNLLKPVIATGFARILQLVSIVLIALLFNSGLNSIGLSRDRILPGIKAGLIWSFIFALLAALGFSILLIWYNNPLKFIHTKLPETNYDLFLYFIIGGFVAPFCEEIFFRGIIYGFFRKWGILTALLLSSIIFVLLHPIKTGLPITQLVGGLVFALSYEKTRSLITPFIIHFLGNTAIFVLSINN